MKKHLSAILSLMAICGHIQADSSSLDYDYGYPEFVESSKDRQEKAISIFNQLIPQNEKEKWEIIYDCRSEELTEIEWFCLDGKQFSWVSVICCNRGYFDETYRSHMTYGEFDDDDYHYFTKPNNFQVIEEIPRELGSKSLSLTTSFSDIVFIITFDINENLSPRQIDDKFMWEAIRELWIQRFLDIQFPIKIRNDDSNDSIAPNEL